MKKITTTLAAVAVMLVGCGGAPEPIAAPDLLGRTLDDVRDTLRDIDLELEEVDASGEDRSVWSAGNWTVIGQDPAAGVEVEPGSTVTVEIENVRDVEPDEPEEADSPTPEPSAEAAPEADGGGEDAGSQADADVASEFERLARQGFDWYVEDAPDLNEAMDALDTGDLWPIESFDIAAGIRAVEGFKMIGDFAIIETGIHPDGAGAYLDNEDLAERICNVALSHTYDLADEIRWIEVEDKFGGRLARCEYVAG